MFAETYSLLSEAFTTNSDAFCTISEAFLRLRNLLLLFRCAFTRILTDIHSFGRVYQLFGYFLPKFGRRFVIAEAILSLRKPFHHCGRYFVIVDAFLSFRKPFHFFGDIITLSKIVFPSSVVLYIPIAR